MKTQRRLVYVILLLMILSLLLSCTRKVLPQEIEQSFIATSHQDPMTFTLFSADPNESWNQMQDDIGKVITARTGVTLKMEYASDPTQKIASIAASRTYPDLIMPKGDGNILVDAGVMMDLTDLIEEHGPNLKKVYKDYMNRLRWSSKDHAIYFLPNLDTVDNIYFDASGGFQLQHAVVKELGYPEIKTVQDFENAIRAYKEKYPVIDGQPTIGLSLLADDWRMLITVTNPAFYTTGAPDDGEWYIDPKTYQTIYHYRRPEEKEYFRWLNHMYNSDLLDHESFVQQYDQYKAKIASGRVLGLIDQKWQFNDAQNILKHEGKYERTYGHYPVVLNENYKNASFQATGFMAGWGIGITKDNKDPVRAIQFLDWLASDEGQVLINWGIEDEHYIIEDGRRIVPEEILQRKVNDASNFAKTTGMGMYNISARYGDGVMDPSGNYYTTSFPELISRSYSEMDKEVLAAYGVNTWKDLFPSEDEFSVRPWGAGFQLSWPSDSELNVIFQRCNELMREYIPEVILAEPEQFDALWDEFMEALVEAGVEQMEIEVTQLVKERVALWGN